MLNPFRYALRQLARTPGFTVVAVLILALGIGVTTAAFSIVNALLFRALPARAPENLVLFTTVRTTTSGTTVGEKFSFPTFERLRDNAKSLAGAVVIKNSSRKLLPNPTDRGTAILVRSSAVSGNLFALLGVSARLGRTLLPDDDEKNRARPVAAISESLWQRQFGGAPDVLGRTVLLDNVSFTIVGVMPAAFFGIEPADPVDLWIPVQALPLVDLNGREQLDRLHGFFILGRLRDGISRVAAGAELDALYQAQATELGAGSAAGDRASKWGKLHLVPGGGGRREQKADTAQFLVALLVLVGLVLMIVCANIASLLLARTAARQHEFAVRAALGASRLRLMGQLLAEGLVLSIVGGLGGLVVVQWLVAAFSARPDGAPFRTMAADPRVLAFAFLVSTLAGILVALVPALKFSSVDVNTALKDQARTTAGGRRSRAVRVLVVAQVAISMGLLAGAGVFVRALQTVKDVDVGFRRENLLAVTLSLPNGYAESRKVNLLRELLAAFERLPGVRSVTVSQGGLWDGTVSQGAVRVEGYATKPNENMKVFFAHIGPNFFSHMGLPLVRGRGFTAEEVFATDIFHPRLAVINEAFAKRFFGDTDPMGRTVNVMSGKAEIVGVARNAKYANLRDESSPQLYLPFAPDKGAAQLTLSLRTDGHSEWIVTGATALVHRIDANVGVVNIQPLEERVARFVRRERLIAEISGYFGGFALLLACLGLYGLLAYDVAQRTREFGVRLALGAQRFDLVSLVVRQGMTLAGLGCAIGAAGAFGLVHFIASKLFGVRAADPLTFGATALLLLGVSLLACWLPSRRATKADPMIALRAQ